MLKIKSLIWDIEQNGNFGKLVWISSHVRIPGNKQADALAKDVITHGRDSQLGVLLGYKNTRKKLCGMNFSTGVSASRRLEAPSIARAI